MDNRIIISIIVLVFVMVFSSFVYESFKGQLTSDMPLVVAAPVAAPVATAPVAAKPAVVTAAPVVVAAPVAAKPAVVTAAPVVAAVAAPAAPAVAAVAAKPAVAAAAVPVAAPASNDATQKHLTTLDDQFKSLSEQLTTKNVKSSKYQLGDKWVLSGVGDGNANDDWLRITGKDNKGYYGGVAMGKLWVDGESHLVGDVSVGGTLNTSKSVAMNDNPLLLRSAKDSYHGMYFAGDVDGPVLHGNGGGKILSGGAKGTAQLKWNAAGVTVPNKLTAGTFCVGNTCVSEAQLANMIKKTA